MNLITIKEFAQQRQMVQIVPRVRENINGYPYITFIDKDNHAENIYFSKGTGSTVAAGNVVDKALMSKLQIAFTKNDAGEERIKLVSNERVDIMDLLD
jgi:uncharacterized protein YbcV (DUF1398 family)